MLWRDRRGATALEFALVAPAFLACLFGVFQLGWALHCNESVDYALNKAARSLVSNPSMTQDQVQTNVRDLLTSIADPSNVTVTLTEDDPSASPRMAHLSASYVHTVSVPGLDGFSYTYQAGSTTILSP
jgi:Flp pilus assembly protein TadG